MFGKVIVFGLFKMIKKENSEDSVPGSGFGLRFGYDGMGRHIFSDIRA